MAVMLCISIVASSVCCQCVFFFFNDTATTEIYTLSLHDALPISPRLDRGGDRRVLAPALVGLGVPDVPGPRAARTAGGARPRSAGRLDFPTLAGRPAGRGRRRRAPPRR